MKKGQKVIFNQTYVDEVYRHTERAKQLYEIENMPDMKEKALEKFNTWQQHLDKVECFQDEIEEIFYEDIPKMCLVKTKGGHQFPARVLQVV